MELLTDPVRGPSWAAVSSEPAKSSQPPKILKPLYPTWALPDFSPTKYKIQLWLLPPSRQWIFRFMGGSGLVTETEITAFARRFCPSKENYRGDQGKTKSPEGKTIPNQHPKAAHEMFVMTQQTCWNLDRKVKWANPVAGTSWVVFILCRFLVVSLLCLQDLTWWPDTLSSGFYI